MIFRLNPTSGIPVYVQLVEQIKHAIEKGVVQSHEQLPSVRKMAEDLLINPNTVARAYQELEREGVIELKQGAGAFVRDCIVARTKLMQKAEGVLRLALDRLTDYGLSEEEIRRLVENELATRRATKQAGGKHA
jgi:GntR family transcriptional regulator